MDAMLVRPQLFVRRARVTQGGVSFAAASPGDVDKYIKSIDIIYYGSSIARQ
jgi:hypothetical protein